MEEGAKGKGIVRFRVWHWHDAKQHKPTREGLRVAREEHKEKLLPRRDPTLRLCRGSPAGCQGRRRPW